MTIDNLNSSDDKLNLALECSNSDFWEMDLRIGSCTYGESWSKKLGYQPGEISQTIEGVQSVIHPDDISQNKERLNAYLKGETSIYETECRLKKKNGDYISVLSRGKVVEWEDERPVKLFGINIDISQRKRAESYLQRIEWLLDPQVVHISKYSPPYGNLTELNTSRLILDSVGEELLKEISGDSINLLGTSGAIYEKNGDYALGIFSSGYCQFLDNASRHLCETKSNRKALKSGKWLCHESCWKRASKQSIQKGKPVDIECSGGLHLYAIPIFSGNEIVGSMNIGWGSPPDDINELNQIAERYHVDIKELQKIAAQYEPRPEFIVETAKKRLETSAKLIGEIVYRKKIEKELIQNQHQFKMMFEKNPIGIALYDQTGNLLKMNNACLKIFGAHNEEEMKKYNLFQDPNISDELKKELNKTNYVHFQGTYDFGQKRHTSDQSKHKADIRYFDVIIASYSDIAYKLSQYIIIIQDTTDRRIADAILRESEERFRVLIENLPGGVFAHDLDGKILFANKAACQFTGYTREELLSKHVSDIDPESVTRKDRELIWEMLNKGQSKVIEGKHIRKDGRAYDAEIHLSSITFDKKRVILPVVFDTSNRKAAEKALKLSMQTSSDIVNEIPSGLFIYEYVEPDKLYFVTGNPEATKLTGIVLNKSIGKEFNELWPNAKKDGLTDSYLKVMRTGKTFETDALYYQDDQISGAFKIRAFKLPNNRLAVAFENVTMRKQMETEREQLITDLENKNAELERFVYTVSHDLKSPMITIQGFTGLMSKSILNKEYEQIPDYIDRISGATHQMENLLKDLLELSRIGRVVNLSSTVSMNQIVFDALSLLEGIIEKNQVLIVVQPHMPEVTVDRIRLQEVISNLVENAIKYRHKELDPEIEIGCESKKDCHHFYVKDNGIGIESKYQEKVFGLFDQLDPNVDGTGVGLALVKRIIEFHGGKIWIESDGPGKGCTFYFTLASVEN